MSKNTSKFIYYMRPFNILQGSAVLMASCLCFHERELNKTIKLQSPREELNVTLSNSVLRCSITEPQRLFRNLAAIPGLLNSTSPAYCHDQWAQWKSISERGI